MEEIPYREDEIISYYQLGKEIPVDTDFTFFCRECKMKTTIKKSINASVVGVNDDYETFSYDDGSESTRDIFGIELKCGHCDKYTFVMVKPKLLY